MKKISELCTSQQLFLIGNTLITLGSMVLSIGSLFSLAEAGELTGDVLHPIGPITKSPRSTTTARDYFA